MKNQVNRSQELSTPTGESPRPALDSSATEPVWIVFDGRAMFGDTENAAVLESFGSDVATTDEQAIQRAKRDWYDHEFALYRYDLNAERVATNERCIQVKYIKER